MVSFQKLFLILIILNIEDNEKNIENFLKRGFILDEMNLSSSKLLEYLYNYLNRLKKKK